MPSFRCLRNHSSGMVVTGTRLKAWKSTNLAVWWRPSPPRPSWAKSIPTCLSCLSCICRARLLAPAFPHHHICIPDERELLQLELGFVKLDDQARTAPFFSVCTTYVTATVLVWFTFTFVASLLSSLPIISSIQCLLNVICGIVTEVQLVLYAETH